jgi:hypothetical protein
VHAQLLRRNVWDHLGDPATFARAWDEDTEQRVAPFYWNQIRADRARLAEMTALRDGRARTPDDSAMSRLVAGAPYDADLFRALIETITCMALPQEVISRPGIKAKIEQSGREALPAPGPDRQQLLSLLAA